MSALEIKCWMAPIILGHFTAQLKSNKAEWERMHKPKLFFYITIENSITYYTGMNIEFSLSLKFDYKINTKNTPQKHKDFPQLLHGILMLSMITYDEVI